jgi:hypothetical protein
VSCENCDNPGAVKYVLKNGVSFYLCEEHDKRREIVFKYGKIKVLYVRGDDFTDDSE